MLKLKMRLYLPYFKMANRDIFILIRFSVQMCSSYTKRPYIICGLWVLNLMTFFS